MEDCKARGGRLAYPDSALQRASYLELVEANSLWVLNLRSLNLTETQCPALVAGQTQFSRLNCSRRLGGVCSSTNCPGAPWQQDNCCRLTRLEAWTWQRNIQVTQQNIFLSKNH